MKRSEFLAKAKRVAGRNVAHATRIARASLNPNGFRNWSALALPDYNKEALSFDPGLYDHGKLYEAEPFALRQVACRDRMTIYPAYRYDKPLPDLRGPESACEAALAEARYQAAHLSAGCAVEEARLSEGIVYGNAVYVREGDAVLALYESARENDRRALLPITRTATRRIEVREDWRGATFIGSPGSSNYGHWLSDDLTRVVRPAAGTDAPVFLMSRFGRLLNERRAETLALALGRTPVIHLLNPTQAYAVPDLRYASRASHHPALKSPEALAATRAAVTGALPAGMGKGPRLLIGRSGARRKLVNSNEIESLLTSLGFATLDPLEATGAEQAAACAEARVIVGVMGAAMTNTLFAAPDAVMIYLAPAGWTEPYYWDLAAASGHRYVTIFGDTTGGGDVWERPFRIDPALLATALAEHGVT